MLHIIPNATSSIRSLIVMNRKWYIVKHTYVTKWKINRFIEISWRIQIVLYANSYVLSHLNREYNRLVCRFRNTSARRVVWLLKSIAYTIVHEERKEREQKLLLHWHFSIFLNGGRERNTFERHTRNRFFLEAKKQLQRHGLTSKGTRHEVAAIENGYPCLRNKHNY